MDPQPSTTDDDVLAELASLGMRAARAVTRMVEIETECAEIVAAWLPQPGRPHDTYADAGADGRALDLANDIMARSAPRAAQLTGALDRLARTVRRTIALRRRLAAGWTGTRADTRPAMLRRQLARRVGQAIRHQHGDTEHAERLFDDLALRLHDPALDATLLAIPVDQLVHRLCHELGLALDDIPQPILPNASPPDTG